MSPKKTYLISSKITDKCDQIFTRKFTLFNFLIHKLFKEIHCTLDISNNETQLMITLLLHVLLDSLKYRHFGD